MNIRNKIQVFSLVWLVLILCITNVSIYWLFYKQMTDQEIGRLQQQAQNIAQTLHATVNQVDPADFLQAYLTPIGMIRVVNAEGHAVLTAAKDVKFGGLKPAYSDAEVYRLEEKDGVLYAIAQVPVIWKDGTVVSLEMTNSLAGTQETMSMLLVVLVLASLFVLLPALFAGRMLGNIIVGPIQSMMLTMEEIQKRGVFKKLNLPPPSKDELYQLGNTFNKMIDILHQNFTKQQQFVSDASHELKTPLTVIEGYATMLKRWGMKEPDMLEEAVDAIYAEAVRMKTMTQQMLMLANPDEKSELALQEVDLVKLSEETSKWMKRTYEHPITVHVREEQVLVCVDEQKIKQLLVILLDNALTYSSKPIQIEIEQQPRAVKISVIDQGVGIPAEDLPHIFDRFYRVDKARARETGGTGLGLSIAKRIVDAHGGEINVLSEEGRGTTFMVTLPKEVQISGVSQ
ncbi:HAMP domain-containing protein [Brevibacillus nitrificans]|uniref:Signal transduction histidine-protein kinase ArlS n=1 Tax=Brevibacillus nitrificans TaxID=651560 RepID=A0A3M8CQV0_9BACL|nr:ATP-binding protein [Brevibacillus nitrificans]RNB78142.1 HAMP domain-containing protein [Brevibacillus nitrificans]